MMRISGCDMLERVELEDIENLRGFWELGRLKNSGGWSKRRGSLGWRDIWRVYWADRDVLASESLRVLKIRRGDFRILRIWGIIIKVRRLVNDWRNYWTGFWYDWYNFDTGSQIGMVSDIYTFAILKDYARRDNQRMKISEELFTISIFLKRSSYLPWSLYPSSTVLSADLLEFLRGTYMFEPCCPSIF